MIPLAVPDLSGNERKYLNECIDTTYVSSVGGFVNEMEKQTARICGTKYAVASSSGTTGLHLALTGCGVMRDDLVIMPSFTFIATANAAAHCGAVPWLFDIDPDTWTISENQLQEELEKHAVWSAGRLIHRESGRRIAAVMPVYTLGNIPRMDRIRRIAAEYQLPVIADAAAAIGAAWQGEKIGKLADLTVFSFNGNKTVTAGGGGMVAGDDEALLQLIRHLSTTARVSAEYDHDRIGFNYRMTNIQAAVGCAQLERLDELVEKKRKIREYYHSHLKNVRHITLFPNPQGQDSACWFSGIVLEQGGIGQIRGLCRRLAERNIEARSFWKPVHLQQPYKDAQRASSLAQSEKLWERILTLPCSVNISEEELAYVVSVVKEILQ